MRALVVGLVGLSLLSVCLVGGGLSLLKSSPRFEGPCQAYVSSPREGWVTLGGCQLEMDDLVLMNSEGAESLRDRLAGISHRLYTRVPQWERVYAPVIFGDQGRIGAIVQLAEPSLLAWINALEVADEAKRRTLVSQERVRWRLGSPGVLSGYGKPAANPETFQRLWGPRVRAGVFVIEPGGPPQEDFPVGFLLAGLGGLGLVLWAASHMGNRRSSNAHREEVLHSAGATLDVSDVELRLGEIEELRREARDASGGESREEITRRSGGVGRSENP